MLDDKYVVFTKEEFDPWLKQVNTEEDLPNTIHDAVVLRRQDIFAGAALSAYAFAVQVWLDAHERIAKTSRTTKLYKRLEKLRDDFFEESQATYEALKRKVPD